MKRVFTKKCLEFKNRETGERVKTLPMEFCELPEWAVDDPLYQWSMTDGSLEELTEKKAGRKMAKELNGDGETGQ